MSAPEIRYDRNGNIKRIAHFEAKGVEIWGSERVYINEDVPLEAIAPGAILMNAIISGERVSIGAGTQVGVSGTARVHNACFGKNVQLGAGTYTDCVLLDGVIGHGFVQIRPGTILEEDVRIGHNVGLKNSILTSWTTAGSCINFCDVFVTGGTSRQDHSEIGSGAMHFNFSPKRDKFASTFGDVRGLLLRSPRIFIGGNSGIVAPCEVSLGQVIPAGTTLRLESGSANNQRKLAAGLRFLATLSVLNAWYQFVRLPFSGVDERVAVLAAIDQIGANLAWRAAELQRFRSSRGECALSLQPQILDGTVFRKLLGDSFFRDYALARRSFSHVAALAGVSSQAVAEAETGLLAAMAL